MEDVLHYIQNHLDQNFNINDVCAHISKSRRWLEYAFHRHLHQTPRQFISEQRVKRVKALLLDPQKHKLGAIASMSGFVGSNQMNQVFKKVEGCTPREYRNQHI